MAEKQVTSEELAGEVARAMNPFIDLLEPIVEQPAATPAVIPADKVVEKPTIEPIVEELIEIETAMGKMKVPKSKVPVQITPNTTQTTKLYEDFLKEINEKTKSDFKSSDDIVNIFTKQQELEKSFEEIKKNLEIANTYKSVIDNSPVEIKNIIIDYAEGKDYKATIKQLASMTAFDFNKEAKEIDETLLIQHYNPELLADQLEDMQDATRLALANNARERYTYERQSIVNKEKDATVRAESNKKQLLTSVDISIAKLKAQYPDMPDKNIEAIRDTMLRGITTKLVDERGYYRDDAAVTLSLGLFGNTVIEEFKSKTMVEYQKVFNEEIQKEREQFLLKYNDNPLANRKGSAGDVSNLEDIVRAQIPFIKPENGGFDLRNKTKSKE
jgi:hypothetical protein